MLTGDAAPEQLSEDPGVNKSWMYAGLAVAAGVSAVGLVKLLSGPRIVPGKSRVFLLGDSLAVGLTTPLRALSAEASVPFEALAKEGTRIDQWAQNATLYQRLQAFAPTLILVSLGTNDEYMGAGAPERQDPYLQALLKNLRAIAPDVAWIGPPKLPRASSGITALIRSRVPNSNYFPSENLEISRGPDGLHPTARGYAAWAGSIWRWLS